MFLALLPRRFALAALIGVLMVTIAQWNLAATQWHGALWPWIAASFVVCFALPALWPQLLDRFRAPTALGLALPVPLALFAMKVLSP